MAKEPFFVRRAIGENDFAEVTAMMREYIAWLPFDVGSFQDVERELANVAIEYGPPRGVALLATDDDGPAGVVGVRRFDDGIAELKRMWARPRARGLGIGMALGTRALAEAREMGYTTIRLDTVIGVMDGANRLYESLGFRDIGPYRTNPIPGARFMELDL
jgi:GNAT superfamily N-acetyltransferase